MGVPAYGRTSDAAAAVGGRVATRKGTAHGAHSLQSVSQPVCLSKVKLLGE